MKTCRFSELKPGDWFLANVYELKEDVRYMRLICVISEGTADGAHRGWCREVGVIYFSHDSEVTPLPDCTGWDWEPEPEVFYRNEYGDCRASGVWYQSLERTYAIRDVRRPYIGYTIRRTWPDGRVEQEFVPKEES